MRYQKAMLECNTFAIDIMMFAICIHFACVYMYSNSNNAHSAAHTINYLRLFDWKSDAVDVCMCVCMCVQCTYHVKIET